MQNKTMGTIRGCKGTVVFVDLSFISYLNENAT